MDFNHFTKTWLSRLNLKLFATNSRPNLLPNLWCLCNINLDPDILDIDSQHVSFKIVTNGTEFGFSVVYASNSDVVMRSIWLKLSSIMTNIPWSFIGDFNSIISAEEYKHQFIPYKIPINDFHNWSDSNQLIHLPTLDNYFTWCNGRKGRHIVEKRLDRVNPKSDLITSPYSIPLIFPKHPLSHILSFLICGPSMMNVIKLLRMCGN